MGVVTASPLQTVDCWILKGECPVAQVHCVWPICRPTYTLEACVPDTVKLIAANTCVREVHEEGDARFVGSGHRPDFLAAAG